MADAAGNFVFRPLKQQLFGQPGGLFLLSLSLSGDHFLFDREKIFDPQLVDIIF